MALNMRYLKHILLYVSELCIIDDDKLYKQVDPSSGKGNSAPCERKQIIAIYKKSLK